eukprot:jgi/Mesvir1/6259/Mv11456-RA.2
METKSPLSAEAGGTSSETYFGDLLGLDDYDETQTAKEIRNDAIQLEWPLNSAADIDKLLVGGQAPLNIVAGDLSDGEPSPTSTDHDEEEHDDNKHGGDQPTPISINNTKPASSQVDAATTNKQPDAPTTQPTAVIRMSNASEMVEISRADLAREAFKLEEASLAASALREVNRHMNEEVERLAAQVAIVSGERDDIRTHSEHLGKLLHEARAQLAQAPATSVPVTPSEALRDMRVALPPQEGEDDPSLLQAAMHTSGKLIVGRHGKRLENILQHLRRFGRRNGWLIEPRQLTNLEKIGEGTSSDVFLANFRGTPVAVKSLKASWVEGDGLGSFARELAVVSTVRHPNVLCFMGAVIDVTAVPSCFLVVTEYVCGGTLKQVLHGRPAGTDAGVGGGPRTPPSRRNLSMMTRLEIGIQVGGKASQSDPNHHRSYSNPKHHRRQDITISSTATPTSTPTSTTHHPQPTPHNHNPNPPPPQPTPYVNSSTPPGGASSLRAPLPGPARAPPRHQGQQRVSGAGGRRQGGRLWPLAAVQRTQGDDDGGDRDVPVHGP